MSWKSGLAKNLQELRIHLCQTGTASEGAREFVAKSYAEIKKANPTLPVLVREASGVEAKLIARYAFGKEKSVKVDGLKSADIAKELEKLAASA